MGKIEVFYGKIFNEIFNVSSWSNYFSDMFFILIFPAMVTVQEGYTSSDLLTRLFQKLSEVLFAHV